jgi:hypothetical protein
MMIEMIYGDSFLKHLVVFPTSRAAARRIADRYNRAASIPGNVEYSR